MTVWLQFGSGSSSCEGARGTVRMPGRCKERFIIKENLGKGNLTFLIKGEF